MPTTNMQWARFAMLNIHFQTIQQKSTNKDNLSNLYDQIFRSLCLQQNPEVTDKSRAI